MLKLFAGLAPPIALLMVGVLLLEPPALTPATRVPTLRLLTSTGPEVPRLRDIVLEPEAAVEPEPTAELEPTPEPDAIEVVEVIDVVDAIDIKGTPKEEQPDDDIGDSSTGVRE